MTGAVKKVEGRCRNVLQVLDDDSLFHPSSFPPRSSKEERMMDESKDESNGGTPLNSSIVNRQSSIDSSFILPPSSFPPSPPWELEGATVVFVTGWRSLLALVRYDASPVGAYEELAVVTLTRQGPTVVEMVVNSEASMVGGRRGWGFPKQLGKLRWEPANRRITFRAGARSYRVRMSAPGVPIKLSAWCWQVLDGRRVRVPLRIAGTARIGWQGRRIGLVIDPFKLGVLQPELLKM